MYVCVCVCVSDYPCEDAWAPNELGEFLKSQLYSHGI